MLQGNIMQLTYLSFTLSPNKHLLLPSPLVPLLALLVVLVLVVVMVTEKNEKKAKQFKATVIATATVMAVVT